MADSERLKAEATVIKASKNLCSSALISVGLKVPDEGLNSAQQLTSSLPGSEHRLLPSLDTAVKKNNMVKLL